MVQTRWSHLNENFNLLTKCRPLVSTHLPLSSQKKKPIVLLILMERHLEKSILDAGGWQHDTLARDLDLSYRTAQWMEIRIS